MDACSINLCKVPTLTTEHIEKYILQPENFGDVFRLIPCVTPSATRGANSEKITDCDRVQRGKPLSKNLKDKSALVNLSGSTTTSVQRNRCIRSQGVQVILVVSRTITWTCRQAEPICFR